VLPDKSKLASDCWHSLNLYAQQMAPLSESSGTVKLEIDA